MYETPLGNRHWSLRNSHVLCGWIAGHEAEYMETLPEEEVKQAITKLIRTFTGESQSGW